MYRQRKRVAQVVGCCVAHSARTVADYANVIELANKVIILCCCHGMIPLNLTKSTGINTTVRWYMLLFHLYSNLLR